MNNKNDNMTPEDQPGNESLRPPEPGRERSIAGTSSGKDGAQGWRRAVVWTIALPIFLAAGIALVLGYEIYASNRILDQHIHLEVLAAPQASQSLLVFAPHCDDETLGVGGLMYEAAHVGCGVHVVVITNGDGFRIGVSREFGKINLVSEDYVRYGYHRQTETRAALKVLGVPASNVTFLGYPDRGLMPMWTTNWSASSPYTSYYTHTNHSPYNDAPTPHAPYCGEALLADIMRQMEKVKPTDIYVTHPNDDHPDHAAASVFVRTALDRLRDRGEAWALNAHLHYYIVHRGDWPVPQGLHEDFSLPPPAKMANGETHWYAVPLTRYETMRKYAAIKRYPSQTEMTGRFLFSFARNSELLGTLSSGESRLLPRVANGAIGLDGRSEDWNGIAPIEIDPVADTIGRFVKGGADIARMYMARDDSNLYIRVDMREAISPGVVYTVSLRPLRDAAVQPPFLSYTFNPAAFGATHALKGAAVYRCSGSMIELIVPLTDVQLTDSDRSATVDLAASTRYADIQVDKTGYYGAAFHPAPQQ